MRRLRFYLTGAIVVAGGILLAATTAPGEECTLSLKRVAAGSRYTQADYQIRATYPQSVQAQFYEQSGSGRTRIQFGGEDREKAFKRIVKKEPAKYDCKHPFRGVLKLGTQEFAFVFDAAGAKPDEKEDKAEAEKPKPKEKAKAKSSLLDALSSALTGEEAADQPSPRRPGKAIVYNRLYFDVNGNGDLTDDKPIESEKSGDMVYNSGNYSRAQFPAVTVALAVDGTKYDYTFTSYVTYQAMDDRMGYAYASFNSATYRDGEITLEGKKRRVVLIDFNSNGRFDDAIKLRDDVRGRDNEVYPTYGDVLMFDPQASTGVYLNPYDATSSGNRYNVSKLVDVDGKFYDLAISPAGDKLSLTPATPSLGFVTNPNEGFSAVVYGDKGFLKIRGGKGKPVALPEGSWKLLTYTIDQTGMEERVKPAAEKKDKPGEKQSSLLSAVVSAIGGGVASSSPARLNRFSRVSATATKDYKPVEVRKGQTVALPFGPPYKPTVRVDYAPSPDQVRLSMTLVGTAGERCSDMMVQGSRPSKPEFTIKDPKGEVVYRGSFEYG
jgi:hypothetical protein